MSHMGLPPRITTGTRTSTVGLHLIDENHSIEYPRDVAAGAAIGMISSYVLTTRYKGWSVEPQVDNNYYGVRLVKSW